MCRLLSHYYKWRNIHRKFSTTLHHYITSNMCELVNKHTTGKNCEVINYNLTCYLCRVADNAPIADNTVMGNVHIFHKKVIGTYDSFSFCISTA